LDCCLANAEWCSSFPTTTIYHLPMMWSDHAPILAVLKSNRALNKKATYQVETNLSMQTMKTSIWVTRCWSNGDLMGGGRGGLQNSWEVGGVICKGDFANHPFHLP
jgi:hypothetical protein